MKANPFAIIADLWACTQLRGDAYYQWIGIDETGEVKAGAYTNECPVPSYKIWQLLDPIALQQLEQVKNYKYTSSKEELLVAVQDIMNRSWKNKNVWWNAQTIIENL